MHDEPQDDHTAACLEIAALAVALAASGNLPPSARRHLARIANRGFWVRLMQVCTDRAAVLNLRWLFLHRFAEDAERDYLAFIDGTGRGE